MTDDIKSTTIQDAANASTSYALPVDNLTGMLATHVEWANRASDKEGKEQPQVVTYQCKDFDFETFEVVYKILTRSYVGEDDINSSKDCLDFFGPFSRSDILVNLSVENMDPSKMERPTKKARDNDKEKTSNPDDFDSSLIICESEARMRAVASVALALGETQYVPFKMLFVEGVLEAECEMEISAVEVPMMPAACFFGDHDNIFCLRKIVSRRSLKTTSFKEIHSDHNLFKNIPSSILESKLSGIQPGAEIKLLDIDSKVNWKEQSEVFSDLKTNGYGLELKVGLKSTGGVKSAALNSVLYETYDMTDKNSKTIYLPGLEKDKVNSDENGSSFFHRNANGEVVFTEKEAERASKFIASSDIEERVKAALQQKRFVLPQEMSGVQAHFCNESVYGKINILLVCGLVRFDPETDHSVKEPSSQFDAWPSAEANCATATARARINMNARMSEFFFDMA